MKPTSDLRNVNRVSADGVPLLEASHVSINVCGHGIMRVQFHDANQRIFAIAKLNPKDAATFLGCGLDSLEAQVGSLEEIMRPN